MPMQPSSATQGDAILAGVRHAQQNINQQQDLQRQSLAGAMGASQSLAGAMGAPNNNAASPQADGKPFIDPGISNNHSAPF